MIIYINHLYECYDHLYLLEYLKNNKSNNTDVTSESETAYHSGAPEFIPAFSEGCVARNLVFCVVLCRSLFVLCFWSFYYLSFFDLRLLITSFGIFKLLLVFCRCCLSFCQFSFDHCVVCPSSIYGFWLPVWYIQSVLSITQGAITNILKKKEKQFNWIN